MPLKSVRDSRIYCYKYLFDRAPSAGGSHCFLNIINLFIYQNCKRTNLCKIQLMHAMPEHLVDRSRAGSGTCGALTGRKFLEIISGEV